MLIPFIFCVERTLFYISKAWFYREFFSKGSFQDRIFKYLNDLVNISSFETLKEHFGILFMLSNIPAGAANFVVDPIYQNLILNGDNLADANFKKGNFLKIALFQTIESVTLLLIIY